ncbi:alpha/beta fold hydrolase [Hoeflea sp. CAU 1731]
MQAFPQVSTVSASRASPSKSTTPKPRAKQMDVVSDRTEALYFESSGTGTPILLLHPIGLDHSIWRPYVDALSQNHQVVSIDLPGHGRSRAPDSGWDFADLVASIDRCLSGLALPTHVIGASFGGMIAQYIAIARPQRIRSLVLCCTASQFPDNLRSAIAARGAAALRDGMGAIVPETLERWFTVSAVDGMTALSCKDLLLASNPAVWDRCWKTISLLNTTSGLASLDIPALVLSGENDVATPPALSQTIAHAMPNSELVIMPDASHMGCFETPQPYISAIQSFLQRVDEARSNT